MYTITINNYTKFRKYAKDGAILHESVEFCEEFDRFLDECIVPESNFDLSAVRSAIIRSIIPYLRNYDIDEMFVLCIGGGAIPMLIRTTATDDSVLIELTNTGYDVIVCSL